MTTKTLAQQVTAAASMNHARRRRRDSGQALVIMLLALVAMLAMAALVVDGGNAFVQQRTTQNGADAAAEAGAVVLAQNLTGGGHSDQEVLAAVTASATRNAITISSALYTNVNGNSLGIAVGSLGSGMPPSAAAGVRAIASKTFATYVGGILGVNQLTASAQATAVTGPSAGCALSQGCTLLPITFPVSPSLCSNTNQQVQVGSGTYPIVDVNKRTASNESILGICGTANGSVGWLHFNPSGGCGNGANGLECEIATPDFGPLQFPVWVQTETGNVNGQVEDAVNAYQDEVILIPFYDCIKDSVGQLSPGPACPPPPYTGNGNNAYYRVVGVYGFYLDHAYINGNNPECNQAPGQPLAGGNGGTGCLKGWFVQPLSAGAVGSGTVTPGGAVTVQLIR